MFASASLHAQAQPQTSISRGPYGGAGGSQVNRFRCPAGEFIVRLYGRGAKRLDQIGAECSGGGRAEFGGRGGYAKSLSTQQRGIDSVYVKFDQRVHAIGYSPGESIGGDGSGGTETTASVKKPGERMVLTGFDVATGTEVDAIIFYFDPEKKDSKGPTMVTAGPFGTQSGAAKVTLCPENTYVTQISGRAGKRIDRLQLLCSDGNQLATHGGTGGTFFELPYSEQGINLVDIRAGTSIDAVGYGGKMAGGNGGTASAARGATDAAARSLLVGIRVTSSNEVNGIEFLFKEFK
jgi:hypothetical protein